MNYQIIYIYLLLSLVKKLLNNFKDIGSYFLTFVNKNVMADAAEFRTYTRDKFPDMLRGIAVILMIQVHITEVFANDQFREGFWGQLSLFFGGLPAAPVFMFLMGWFAIARSSNIKLFFRGVLVFLVGFLLNIGLNLALIISVLVGHQKADLWPYLFGVDIFSLAGLSLIIISGHQVPLTSS